MIERMHGDILRADAEALVNTVNCVGVMGRGIALQFRKAYPDNYRAYRAATERGQIQIGRMFVHDLGRLANPRYVINFPTKQHWRSESRLTDIEAGLAALTEEIKTRGIRSVALPPLGCGLGGLDWDDVRPRIERAFQTLPDVQVLLYEPTGAPAAATMVREHQVPPMTAGPAVLLQLMQRYLAAAMDPFVSLLEVHKLMYFMQEAGEPLKLTFRKAPYGPYAENLRHVLTRIEGHFIRGYGDAEDNPGKPLVLLPEAARVAKAFLQGHQSMTGRFERVSDLIAGYELPYGMELLSTVHWTAVHDQAMTAEEATILVHGWSEHKRMFEPAHIRIAWETLRDKQWIASAQRVPMKRGH